LYYALDATSDGENCYHRVIDVQPDTQVMFTIPYASKLLAATRTVGGEFGIYCTILSWSQPVATATTPLYFNVYKAGASDFRFGAMRDLEFDVQSNPREIFAQDFESFHPSMTGYCPGDMIYGEEYTSVREMIHRYTAYGTVANASQPVYDFSRTTGAHKFGIELLGFFYRFYRGGIRFKLFQQSTAAPACMFAALDSDSIAGMFISSNTLKQIEGEFPYYQNCLMNDIVNYSVNTVAPQMNISMPVQTCYLFKAAADDFSFHFLYPPPVNFLNPTYLHTPTTQGNVGFRAFYV